MPTGTDNPLDWEAIAEYIRTVAYQAFMRGFSDGFFASGPHEQDVFLNEDERARGAQMYTASGFDVETVKRFHPAETLAALDTERMNWLEQFLTRKTIDLARGAGRIA